MKRNHNFSIYMLKKVLSKAFTAQKPTVNGKIIGRFSTYESRKICRNNSRLSKKLIATYIILSVFLLTSMWGSVGRADSLWVDQGASLYGNKPRSFEVGDLITVVIVEQAKATQEASSSSDETGSVNVGPGTGFLSKILPENIGADWANSSEGEGSTTRGGTLEGKITVQVTGVNPNGILVIEGRQVIKVNNEDQVLKITGMIRAEDINIDNITLSTNIANAVIEYQGNGNINDAQKQGIITRFFHWLF